MEFLLILMPFLLPMIQDCLAKRSSRRVEARLNEPGWIVSLLLRRAIKRKWGLTGEALWERHAVCWQALTTASPAMVTVAVEAAQRQGPRVDVPTLMPNSAEAQALEEFASIVDEAAVEAFDSPMATSA
jgi:hypothetical protein